MKKFTAILLIASLIAPLAACGKKSAQISFEGNPTTGYAPEISFLNEDKTPADESIVKLSEPVEEIINPDVSGSPTKYTYTLEGSKKGSGYMMISFVKTLSNGEKEPARVILYALSVKGNLSVEAELVCDSDIYAFSEKANATTGYEWTGKISDENILAFWGSTYIVDDNPDNLMGVGGTYSGYYYALKDGEANIEFVYARGWEGGETDKSVVENISVTKDEEGRLIPEQKTAE